ncbi:hypothetical protein OG749_25990 [Streptomyces nojiriensis]|uniref:hypothetical protein n=1 Tax=Streptomyces nojiriensis TaxID=66374 RepID=UPI002E16DF5D
MLHIKFWDVFCPALGGVFETIVLRVDEEEIFHGPIEQGQTLTVDKRIPFETMAVELGTSETDGLGNPTGPFRRFVYLEEVGASHVEEHDSLELDLFHDSPHPQRAHFRSKIPDHGGKFELGFSLPG